MIDDACEVILSKETILALSIFAYVKSSGLGSKTKVLAQEMIVTCEEVCDFLFEPQRVLRLAMRKVLVGIIKAKVFYRAMKFQQWSLLFPTKPISGR